MPKKLVYLTLDGLSDSEYEILDNKTPLKYANTPNMDNLAEKSETGKMYTVREGIAPESDQAMFSLLGYDPFEHYTGRGILEAIGAGLKISSGDLILRCNFASAEEGIIKDVEARVSEKEASKLAEKIQNEVELTNADFEFKTTVGYRAVLIIKSEREMSARISNSHPGYEIVENYVSTAVPRPESKEFELEEVEALESTEEASFSAMRVNEFLRKANKVLEKEESEANCILTRGASYELPDIDSLPGTWALMADMPVEKAIGELADMIIIQRPEDYNKAANEVLEALDMYNAVYLQLKGPDSYGHRGKPKKKSQSIEKIDKEFVKPLLEGLKGIEEDVVICLTTDHSTESKNRAHSTIPVPVILTSGEDSVDEFSEKATEEGSLGTFESGTQLYKKIMNVLEW